MKIDIDAGLKRARAFASIVLYGERLSTIQYAMLHPIIDAEGKPRLGAGSALSIEGLNQALNSLAESQAGHKSTDFLPDNVLSISNNHLAWWCKPCVRSVFFKNGTAEASHGFIAPHPGLIMVASGRDLLIGALRGNERPTADTPVYQAPYFNVWSGGRMCVGNVNLPNDTVTSRIGAWEDAFFNSWFTHPNGTGLVNHPGDMVGLWNMLREKEGKLSTFPQDALVPMEKTAKEFIDGLLRRNLAL